MGKIAIIVELKSLDFNEGDLFVDFQGKGKDILKICFRQNFQILKDM